MNTRFQLALCLAFLSVAATRAADRRFTATSTALIGKPAPDFTLPDLTGRPFHLSDHRGHVMVLAFWGTWCGPCRAEMPMLAALQREFAASGVEVLPVAFDDPAKVQVFLQKKKLSFHSLVDRSGTVAGVYGAHAIPKAFLIGAGGVIQTVVFGRQRETDFRRLIGTALTR